MAEAARTYKTENFIAIQDNTNPDELELSNRWAIYSSEGDHIGYKYPPTNPASEGQEMELALNLLEKTFAYGRRSGRNELRGELNQLMAFEA